MRKATILKKYKPKKKRKGIHAKTKTSTTKGSKLYVKKYNGQSQNIAAPNNMGESAIVDGVGSYANGVSSGMSDAIVGDAFGSSANSLSYNMDVLDRTEDTPS